MSGKNIRFGVNYVPSKYWWYSWLEWDKDSISNDLRAIAGLGMDHIRIHCIWPYFQPNENYVSTSMLKKLKELLDISLECGLDVQVAVLDGWLSGFKFVPQWQGNRNMFTDNSMIEAEKLLFRKFAEEIGNHPAFIGFDLGNELTVMQYFGDDATLEEGDKWMTDMLDYCTKLCPEKLHVNGIDHVSWFYDRGFTRGCLSNTGGATSIHAWIEFTGALSKYKPLETGCAHLAEYCIELTKAYSNDLNRPVWLQEFGASSCWMADDIIPEFAEQTILNSISCENLHAVTWWCSHDIDAKFKGFSKLEYDLGLLDVNNNVKPAGNRMAELIKKIRENQPRTIERNRALIFPDRLLSEPPMDFQYPDNPGWKFAGQYMELIEKGVRPAVVLESRASDKEYLRSRGINELIKLKR